MGMARLFLHALSRANITGLYISAVQRMQNIVQYPLTWLLDFMNESPEHFSSLETLALYYFGEEGSVEEFEKAMREIITRNRGNIRTLVIEDINP